MTEAEQIAHLLRAGKLVALPTETVYGLAADAENEAAVRRIFEVKGRPATNPLIVHVADVEAAKACVSAWPEVADRLAAAFWPGPLSLVLPRSPRVLDIVTAGGDTVAVRVPDNLNTLLALRAFHAAGGLGVAAPSANRSEHVSPTRPEHVRDDLGDRVDLIVDGLDCEVGIESTVVRVCDDAVEVLRDGFITREALAAVVPVVATQPRHDEPLASPGQSRRHYAPEVAQVTLAEENELPTIEPGTLVFIRAEAAAAESLRRAGQPTVTYPGHPDAAAIVLYDTLRRIEKLTNRLLIVLPPQKPAWRAIRDRLRRAGG